MKKCDQFYYIIFSVIAILLTAVFQISTSTQRQLSLQILGMPHFIVPLVLLIFSFSVVNLKRKISPLLLSIALTTAYLYLYSLNVQMRVLAVYLAVIYGLAHVIRDQTWIELPARARQYFLPIIIFAAAAFSSLYTFLHVPQINMVFIAAGLIAAFVCIREIYLIIKKNHKTSSMHDIYRLYIFTALALWLLLKALVLQNDFWDLFVYHVIFWYFIYFYQLFKSRNMLRLFYLATLIIFINACYIFGIQYGLSHQWLKPIPSLSLNGVYSAQSAPHLFFALFDVRMFYAWIIFHVTMSWFSNIRSFKPADAL